MPVLPYCIFLANPRLEPPVRGVQGSEIQIIAVDRLMALYSEIEKSLLSASTFQQDALAFHDVVHEVFGHAAVVPFRFPSWLNVTELADHLRKESERYERFLSAHAEHVQMELRLAAPAPSLPDHPARSGTEHLRGRAARTRQLRETADEFRHSLAAEVIEWREREVPEGLRLFGLVHRDQVAGVREKLGGRGPDVSVRWSGPWPATEFLT